MTTPASDPPPAGGTPEPPQTDELLAAVYGQLRAIAQQKLNEERPGHTLQATALVHEAYARLAADSSVRWQSQAQFFFAAAEAMRRILIEHARARGRMKRGGGRKREAVPLNALELAVDSDPEEIASVDDAVRRLEEKDPDLGRIVRLRFYAGLGEQEIADLLGVSERTVRREWVLAKAWLHRWMSGE